MVLLIKILYSSIRAVSCWIAQYKLSLSVWEEGHTTLGGKSFGLHIKGVDDQSLLIYILANVTLLLHYHPMVHME